MSREELRVDELLAKPDISLFVHSQDVVRLGDAIAGRLRLEEARRLKALIACALHDIGKATVDFQQHIRGKRKQAYPHALASLPFVLCLETHLGGAYGWEPTRLEATAAVLAHHSPLHPQLYRDYETTQYHPNLRQLLEEVWVLLEPYCARGLPDVDCFWQQVQCLAQEPLGALLDNPLPFKDHSRSLRGVLQSLPPREYAAVKTVLHLADWLASAAQQDAAVLFLQGGKNCLENHIRRLSLRDFQKQAADASGNVLHLRAPTGTGKTEALLLWAGNAERLIYLLPTQAAANAMWKRLRKLYGENNVGLAHGRASYVLHKESDEDPLDVRLFGFVFAKPVTAATLDQYLLAHLQGRHWEEKRTLAQGATVLLDEIHAYEPYTLGLLLEALEHERPARMALASAILPQPLLRFFPQGHLIEAEAPLWQRRRHRLELREGQLLEEGLEVALALAQQGKSVLVVANTVRDAQAFYRRLQDETTWRKRALLHARFNLDDRQRKEEQVGKPEPGLIFVATQVVEVSLDISYDALLTEIAPVDALVQRMGRVNRGGEKEGSPVVVYRQPSKGSERIYGKELLSRSLEVLQSLSDLPTDADLAAATHRLYQHVTETNDWLHELEDGRRTLREIQDTLGCYTIDLSDDEMRERFTARRGTVSIEVLPAQLEEKALQLKEARQGWRLVELLVPVPIYWLRQRELFRHLDELKCFVTSLPYDSECGLQEPTEATTSIGGMIFD
jgi:CRISPR-associated endonuclease/helicase Cas3